MDIYFFLVLFHRKVWYAHMSALLMTDVYLLFCALSSPMWECVLNFLPSTVKQQGREMWSVRCRLCSAELGTGF